MSLLLVAVDVLFGVVVASLAAIVVLIGIVNVWLGHGIFRAALDDGVPVVLYIPVRSNKSLPIAVCCRNELEALVNQLWLTQSDMSHSQCTLPIEDLAVIGRISDNVKYGRSEIAECDIVAYQNLIQKG
ncbi:hypothetical protein D8674_039971 [Pyrus ussuriensis x Pyrus communis]|uniref:Uncharacterized protein n=1 Tax=Pyrus ussuriensis x Pyrus communis TaxID=2448454 RepID=A0A5N5G2D1_9ROSA|nr:hypothetical protein D8674_039971 [Pyrus ussuriensis x Pyrus communis]